MRSPKKKFKKELSKQYFQRRFWKSLPLRSLFLVLLAVFFTFAILGFFGDLLAHGKFPRWLVFVHVVFSGFLGALYFYAGTHYPKLFILVLAVHLLGGSQLPREYLEFEVAEILQYHLIFDGIGILLCIVLGYTFFILFINTVGLHQVRLNAEMMLAKDVHTILVPKIDRQGAPIEIYGQSLPTEEVGGDLLDVYDHENTITHYIVDVSGHGVAAGLLVGMFKSAIHTELQSGKDLPNVLTSINKTLYRLKKRTMFLTFAGIQFQGNGLAEYAVAGHLPILHYTAASKEITYLEQKQIPLAAQLAYQFQTKNVSYAPGDLFLLLTDGITEVENKQQEEFGMQRIEDIVLKNADDGLKDIFDKILAAASEHGKQIDDQTMMLIRCT